MSKYTIAIDKETAFISFYLAEKEFFHPDKLRDALTMISYLIKVKHRPKSLAIAQTNSKYIKKYNIDYTREFLWKQYNTRLAHIKNAKDKFKLWEIEIKERNAGLKNLCSCGCGQEVKKGNKFINGHNVNLRSNYEKDFYTKIMRNGKKTHTVISDKLIKVRFKPTDPT